MKYTGIKSGFTTVITVAYLCLIDGITVHASAITDTCPTETFHAECDSDEVIVMTSARYGRMSIGRCVKHDILGYLGCQSDVISILDTMCSGRRSCNVRIPDPELNEVSSCFDELKTYLEASYTCYKVVAPMNPCSDTTPIKLIQPQGFLSSYIASTTGCGMEKAPWILQAKPGQLINITFYEFNIVDMDYRESAITAAQCSERAFIMDKQTGRKIKICPRPRRISDVYISTNHTLDITFRTRSVLEEGNHFLIQYQFIGCEDHVPPAGMVFDRTGTMTGTLSCLNSPQMFHLMCTDGHWTGEVENCTEPGLVSQDEDSEKSVISGVLLIGLVALCLILVAVIAGIFVFCIKRLRSNNDHFHEGYIYDESPYAKAAQVHASQCGLKQLHVEMEPCGGGSGGGICDTDTIYKPFITKVPPNGRIQNQINGVDTSGQCLMCSDNNRDNAITEEELNLRNAYSQHSMPNNPRANYNTTHFSPKPPKESNIDNDNRFKTQQRKNSTNNKDRPITLFGNKNKSTDSLRKTQKQNSVDYPIHYPNQSFDIDPSSMYPRNYACAPVKQRPREPIYVAPPSVDLLNNTL